MIKINLYVKDESIESIEKFFGRKDYAIIETVVYDIIERYLNEKYFNKDLTFDTEEYYYCDNCGETAKKLQVFDIKGTSLEKFLVCCNCDAGHPKFSK